MATRRQTTSIRPPGLRHEIGTRLRIISPVGSVFFSQIGIVTHYSLSGPAYALTFPGHPWQEKDPKVRWFFEHHEVEKE